MDNKMEKETKNKFKNSKYPEWYIGRPKPMKTKTFEFHKPTKVTYIKLGIVLAIIIFLVYIVLRLIQVGNAVQPQFEFYSVDKNMQANFIIENEFLKVDMDSSTTQLQITNKKNGKVWYSNPVNVDSDTKSLPKEKNKMKSPLLITYSSVVGTDDVFDIFTKSIKTKSYNISSTKDEIKVDYTIGDIKREYKIPLAFYESDIEKIAKGMSASEERKFLRLYRQYSLNYITDSSERENMLSKYPGLEEESVYIIFDNAQEYLKAQIEDLLVKFNFTEDDYLYYKELYKESVIKEDPAFNLSVIYKLEGNKFTVEIPYDSIAYRLKFPIVGISILPYLGAGSVDDEGYIFIPEGSGSIINFNNGKVKQNLYYADMYGWDRAEGRKAVVTETRNSFPVYGIAHKNDSFISIIENGKEYAGIRSDVSGKLGSYNYVYADYDMLHREQFEVTSRNNTPQYSYENSLPKGKSIKQAFYFIDSSSYVDMAKVYRNYLFADRAKKEVSSIPLVVEVLGSIDKVQQIAGMPKVKPYSLTSYEETYNIISSIMANTVDNVRFKLSGFINGGIKPTVMSHINFISEMGGKSKFKDLTKSLNELNAKFYLDGTISSVYRSGFFDGFNKFSDSARFVSDEICELSEYSPVWYGKLEDKDSYYLANEKLRKKSNENLIKTAKKYDVFGISYRDYGNQLDSDFNDKKHLNRNESALLQIEAMNNCAENNLGVMINAGNDYAIPYVDCITNMQLHGLSYGIIDYTVPFYQIALHGNVDYTSKALNLAPDSIQLLLESAEAGAGLYFTFTSKDEKYVQETDYTEYYSCYYERWKDNFEKIVNEYNQKIGLVKNAFITNHVYLSKYVTKTSYDNGYSVYVNFGYTDYSKEGLLIKARSYEVLKENN